MISRLSLALFVILDDTLTRKILTFYELFACISIPNAVCYRRTGGTWYGSLRARRHDIQVRNSA